MEKKIISIDELTGDELITLIHTALEIKKHSENFRRTLKNRSLLLLFQKTSTRTRVAFELGMKKLGGETIVMDWEKSNFAISPLRYEAEYVGRMFDVILARLVLTEDIVELADSVNVPVINGCCNMYHPSQALADILTMYEAKGDFNISLVYVGVQNNVANSLFYACKKTGIRLTFVTPVEEAVPEDFHMQARQYERFDQTDDLYEAVGRSDFVYTDTWINMEKFAEAEADPVQREKIARMRKYQVNKQLLQEREVYVLHDMPVHPGMEIDKYAIHCETSLIYQQAENRMFTAQALLLHLLEDE
jgi:ornithine carbamoyltransferase